MKAVANEYPAAAVLAIKAGCDGLLICSGTRPQAPALEALVQAVEAGRLPFGGSRSAEAAAAREGAILAARRGRERPPAGPQA